MQQVPGHAPVKGGPAALYGCRRARAHCPRPSHFRKQLNPSWCRADGRIQENAIDSVKGFNVAVDRRHNRRALSDSELKRLFAAAERGKPLQGCTGKERALIYRLAAMTGLRANEIATLHIYSFALDQEVPTLIVKAASSKHRKEDKVRIPRELVPRLQEHFKSKDNEALAFNMPAKPVRTLRYDLENAGIAYKTKEGYADFHCLRHTFISRVVASGVSPKMAQILARHSDARLTLNVYTHIGVIDQVKALNNLPSLEEPVVESCEETQTIEESCNGTEDPNGIGTYVGTSVGSCDSLSDKESHNTAEMESNFKDCKSGKIRMLDSNCHPKSPKLSKINNLEAAGVEPASENVYLESATCLVIALSLAASGAMTTLSLSQPSRVSRRYRRRVPVLSHSL
jgi:integrase